MYFLAPAFVSVLAIASVSAEYKNNKHSASVVPASTPCTGHSSEVETPAPEVATATSEPCATPTPTGDYVAPNSVLPEATEGYGDSHSVLPEATGDYVAPNSATPTPTGYVAPHSDSPYAAVTYTTAGVPVTVQLPYVSAVGTPVPTAPGSDFANLANLASVSGAPHPDGTAVPYATEAPIYSSARSNSLSFAAGVMAIVAAFVMI
ncbi:hypothetical protein BASA50_002185 [Batrachochytrium salamandrivorans]|uniref:Uncharacterized protein n=1 Tax=Batrachochytrium salamandrivorans TaxID=1357716 RepID=A0ABQ8FL97_9FUNG|nr:hypothetical protein BASA62_004593 [Batrachochytrium salamandrivorans]KAH6573987.1 hypothetical protein BASA60_005737 [Batrachochytrium salamandrivorans]KAH6587943.1 hypothetical protein BASA50_011005 [Batrachochytrium salamandrivorans]KAH6598769.1 hypothetical protein BASA50_003472 [Batrachochytrium salamandrivorans]KAH6600619.1 hypothetical protein BASA50_002185 [Batrachochytrium salamandrivorans]